MLCLLTFSQSIYRIVRSIAGVQNALTSENSYYNDYLTKGQLLDGVDRYCYEIIRLMEGLKNKGIRSKGLRNFAEYLREYANSKAFTQLHTHAGNLRRKLSSVEYCVLIKDVTIRIRKYEGEVYLSTDILKLFDKFRQGKTNDYRHDLTDEPRSHHVEASVLNLVAT